ncbi:CDP-glycerol glycerophosphotransferase [Halolactibacillus halophilus]|uniref:CDP-glycerol glycerophosphotransferase n=1 Tax=Halolactibacillus halophilus TaxID=306540 RepID=A0A1I5QHA5_9BACI|nr:CDP-glycerol glycerophosphotransferase family protein [Halolactibacillus halophilus]GEM02802.1 hypothetical protein HHA03_23340 [Halolactibacillus halophilus]SFP45431.1 CDP-glycerol glycerophosphotransferase [Halolactibacillus halophilus]
MIKKQLRKTVRKAISFLYFILFKLFLLLPQQNKIIFESFHGKQFSDNPRAIYEYLQGINVPNLKLIWAIDRRASRLLKDNRFTSVKRLSPMWVYHMATSKYWVTNTRLPLWIPKVAKISYVQTWHGTPLKKLGVDIDDVKMPGTNTENYKKGFLQDSSKWDYLISQNVFSTEQFRRAFNYDGEILECGYPRNDYLINNNNYDYIKILKHRLGIDSNKKIIMYAPTWRDDEFINVGHYKFNLKLELTLLKSYLKDDFIILIRAHYLISEKLDLNIFEGFAINVSEYEDIRDLYLVSDMLITDYSSVFFDYSLLERPILLYAYDLEKYQHKLRGFYLDIEELPFPICRTTEEVLNLIKLIDFNEKVNFSQEYKERFNAIDNGTAAKCVVEQVILSDI